ncbi:MAG TPA: VOC family protein [Candidatus Tumulicola sp.]|jgi:catechol 2,3-dioxygenase-like lactoylglutathione lyase family enzyme
MTRARPAIHQVRVAHPTASIERMRHFYGDLLGLEEIGSFVDHAGYDGVMFACPQRAFHLEFTASTSCEISSWSAESLLVLYVPDRAEYERLSGRLTAFDVPLVQPNNPYWERHGMTFLDPDGRRVVLANLAGL